MEKSESERLLVESIERLKAEIAETKSQLEDLAKEIDIYNCELKAKGRQLKKMEKLLPDFRIEVVE